MAACSAPDKPASSMRAAEQERPAAPRLHDDWEDPRLSFDDLDANHDGEIDHLELQRVFVILDVNQDGVIETDEDVHLVVDADFNEDGVVEEAEFNRVDLTKLDADLNGDGRISREEYNIYRNERMLGLDTGISANRREIDPASRFSIFQF
jgi:Ca2+-binding EF-hand superfamily protein